MFAQYFAQSVKTWPGMDNMSVCPNQELVERCVKGDCSADDKGDVRFHITEFRGWRQGRESIHTNLLDRLCYWVEGLDGVANSH
jgi:hypothetical protein